jgi:AcrR family transcriptional regulator
MPRRYRMTVRSAESEQTRVRIIAAAKSLHAAQGVQGTSYQEIASAAGVALATVYRHFPTLETLLPACSRSIVILEPATPSVAEAIFRGAGGPWERLVRLVRGTCECYGRDGPWLHAARREEDLVAGLSEIVRVQRDNLLTLVQAALSGSGVGSRGARVIAALIDFPLWKSLRDAGLSAGAATAKVLELVHDQLEKEGVSVDDERRG